MQVKEGQRLNDRQMLALLDTSSDAISLLDEKLFPVYRNPAAYRITGYTMQDRLEVNGVEQTHPEDMEKVKRAFKESLENPEKPVFVVFRSLHKKGHYLFLEGTFTNYLHDNNLKSIVCNLRDITDRKHAEKALEDTETIFRGLVQHSFVGVYVHSEGKFVYVNPRMAEIFGYTTQELMLQPVEILAFPADAHIVNENIRLRLERKIDTIHYEVRGTKKNGEIIQVEIFGSYTTYQDKPSIIGSLIDITQRKVAEKSLLKKTYDIGERVKELNALYGTSEIVNRPERSIDNILQECVNIIPPSYQYPEITCARIVFDNKKFMSQGFKESAWKQEAELVNSEKIVGKIEVFYTKEMPREQEGPFLTEERFLINSLADIMSTATERRKAEQTLERYQSNLKAIIENTDASIYSMDTEFRYITFNQFLFNTMKELYGLKIMPGDRVFDFLEKLEPEEAKWWKNVYAKAMKGEALQFVKEFRVNDYHSFSSFSINPIWENNNVIGLSCYARDITKEKLSEEKLIRSEIQIRNFAQHLNHMQEEERAHLAREIHDELGQQLVGIKIGLSSFSKRPEANDKVTELVKKMVKDVDNTIQSLRKIATELRPGILDSLGLLPSLKWLATEFQEKTNIKCRTEFKVEEQNFKKNISICFFRICQEALTNISKHSKASEVIVQIGLVKNTLTMTITDNGQGISGEKLENPFSMGLLGMRERAHVIGGDLRIISKKEKIRSLTRAGTNGHGLVGRGTIIQLSIQLSKV